MVARGGVYWIELDKRGVLTQLDRDNAQKMVRERQAQLKCR